ncbi:hypothetical protein FACS1894208_00850 [Clostridia bacterium]|nr:hypothetical protein FACS1894208_00850 [Clostridia bacterium]
MDGTDEYVFRCTKIIGDDVCGGHMRKRNTRVEQDGVRKRTSYRCAKCGGWCYTREPWFPSKKVNAQTKPQKKSSNKPKKAVAAPLKEVPVAGERLADEAITSSVLPVEALSDANAGATPSEIPELSGVQGLSETPRAQEKQETQELQETPETQNLQLSADEAPLEVVYEATSDTYDYSCLDGLWFADTPDTFGLTIKDAAKLLFDEAQRLSVSRFVIGGVEFNPQNLREDDVLADVRRRSINSLMATGKTYTQTELDGARQKVEACKPVTGLAQSTQIPTCRSYAFTSGVMTDVQAGEFEAAGVLPAKYKDSSPPSPEWLYKAVSAGRLAAGLTHRRKSNFTLEVVAEYDSFWKNICSEMCCKEFGRRSYWIAAGSDWAIGEYASEILKTGFACGLSITPVVSLSQLRAIFERSHGYLNDLEFLSNSPRTTRDAVERFTCFNQAYHAIYEGAVTAYKPKPLSPYRFTYRAYTESDVVIVTLPRVGLVAGGAHVLTELINARNLMGLSTIIVSTCSVRELNELNAGFIREIFDKSGASLIKQSEAGFFDNLRVNNYVYFSIFGDASERGGSAVQKKTQNIAKRQEGAKDV